MKKYRVIALSCAAKRKVYQKGEIVSAASFEPGIAEKLVSKKFLEEVIEEITTTAPNADAGDEGEKAGEIDLTLTVSRETESGNADASPNSDAPQGNQEAGDGKETESTEHAGTANADDKKGGEGIDSISLTQLRKQLRERGVKFSNDAPKEDLFALWLLK